MSKHYIVRSDGVVQSYFFKSDRKFHVNYGYVYRTRYIQKGKRLRVYAKVYKEKVERVHPENYEFTFVLAFATRRGRSARCHWEESSFEIWVEDLVLDYEPSEKWLEDFVRGKLEPTLAESEEMGWVFSLGKVPSDKPRKIGEYWGIEIEKTNSPVHTRQLAKLFRTTDGDYEELKNCRKLLSLI